jgi:tetratricopeptide (TPR) repeat protein
LRCAYPARLDPIFSFCSIACLIISLALSIDLIPRFFAGGVDLWGGLVTIVTPLVGWAFGKEALESAPRSKAFLERTMAAFEIPLERRQLLVFILSALFLLISCQLSGMRKRISNNYYCMSFKEDCKENDPWIVKLRSFALTIIENPDPEANLKVSIALDPSNTDALYQLGWLYERRQDIELAQKNYKIATDIGHLAASNRLAVLQIIESSAKSIDTASTTLLTAHTEKTFDSSKKKIQISWHLTLAWTRYLQDREEEASIQLDLAKRLADTAPELESLLAVCISTAIEQKKFDRNERGKQSRTYLLNQWESCQSESPKEKERDLWVGQATKCIRSLKSRQSCLVDQKKSATMSEAQKRSAKD